MRTPMFRHRVIDAEPPGAHHDILLATDLTGKGLSDIIVGCKEGPANLFWYENQGDAPVAWTRHDMAVAPQLEAGGVLLDINGDGRLDVVAGQQIRGRELYWFEQPADPRGPWKRRVIENRFEKYHDQAVGDVDGDGLPEIVFLSQRSGVLAYYDLPADPKAEPWPEACFHLVADNVPDLEGLAVADLDGDGCTEIVAGTRIYHRPRAEGAPWTCEEYLQGFPMARVAVADLDGDGRLEVVLAEGESHPARLLWLKPGEEPHLLRDDLFHPHSLGIADFKGDGLPDVFVGEMGLGRNPNPKLIVYTNQGGASFRETVIQEGIPTHEAKVVDLNGDGRPDIVGKPYLPERHIDAWINVTP